MFDKTPRTIYTWLDRWEAGRFAGLYDASGRGRKPSLDASQKKQVKRWIKKYPKNLGKVLALIQERVGISVGKRTIQRIVHAFAFPWRRVRRTPKGHPDPESYTQKKQELEALKAQAAQGELDLYFGDESGFCQLPYLPYAWQEKGETMALESEHGNRLNVLGFLSREHGLVAYTTEENVTSALVMAGMDAFCQPLSRKTVVVLDNVSFHPSAALEAKRSEWKHKNLELFYLSKYSPELKLIEMLWRFMKYEWIEWWAYKGWPYLVKYVEDVICGYGTKYKINFV
jgi:transposase